MAELGNSGESRRRLDRGGRRSKKLSTRVDLTPMVDLGFLLITFFIFTTSLSKPKVMKINLPAIAGPEDFVKIPGSGALTLIAYSADSVYVYPGEDPVQGSPVSLKQVRTLILLKKNQTDPGKFTVIIKPSALSTYGNVVGLLDEMLICDVKHYVMTDVDPVELIAVNHRRKL